MNPTITVHAGREPEKRVMRLPNKLFAPWPEAAASTRQTCKGRPDKGGLAVAKDEKA
jgi:hypothetical protein